MPAVESTMIDLGTRAPDFALPNTNPNYSDAKVALSDFSESKGLVVAFICNHCPYVVKIKSSFAEFAREYQQKGIAVVAISANDVCCYPADGPEKMTDDAVQYAYSFPYLYDESQDIARAYGAVCTPDLYLFDSDHKLVYRGQYDDSRPGNAIEATGSDLRSAADSLLAGENVSSDQKPSIGCSIKWKAEAKPVQSCRCD